MPGTYEVVVDDPTGTLTGSVNLTIFDVTTDPPPLFVFANESISGNVSTPGQKLSWQFAMQAQQVVAARVTAPQCCNNVAWIVGPDGGFFHDPVNVDANGFLDARVTTVTGLYTLVVDPGPNTGQFTAFISRFKQRKPTKMSLNHTKRARISRPGDSYQFVFVGTANDRMSIQHSLDDLVPPSGAVEISVLSADPTALAVVSATSTPVGTPVTFTLPQTGTYRILVDFLDGVTGSTHVTLTDCTITGTC
jgi:hypothetical protein